MSDNNKSSSAGGGIGFSGALFITFLVLKLCKVINWSWWWITSPLWIPAALTIAILIVYAIVVAICNRDTQPKSKKDYGISYKLRHLQMDMESENEEKSSIQEDEKDLK